MKKKIIQSFKLWMAILMILALALAGCGQSGQESTADSGSKTAVSDSESQETQGNSGDSQTSSSDEISSLNEKDAPEIPGLTYESRMELQYAECFDVYYYNDGFALIDVHDSARYLVIPEGESVPEGLDGDIVVLQKPLDTIYMAATSVMALFDSLDALDTIRLSGTQASGWYIDNAVAAMESGEIVFAGKYSEPDYELMVDEGCDLAIESTMILHTPKVQEMIEMLGIPVFIDRSSYEPHPLGRTEWIKAYSVLLDKEDQAAAFFDEQTEVISELKDFPNTEKTVAYFYISTDGSVVVRKPGDYIPKMIEIAGGRYAFDDVVDEENNSSSISITMEEFYDSAVNADYLVYNGTIDTPITTVDELLAKSGLFADFKAVKEGNVWCAGKYLYQATDIVGKFITDIHLMLTDGDAGQMTFMTKVN